MAISTVADLFTTHLDPLCQWRTDRVTALAATPLDSHCGQCCWLLIAKGRELMALCDDPAHDAIRDAVATACEIHIFG